MVTRPFHDHSHVPRGSRTLVIAVALTLGFAIIELIGGLWSGSLALLADAGHMATDRPSLLFALIANIVARRPTSERHSFGLRACEIIAAFVNALFMVAVVLWIVRSRSFEPAQPGARPGPRCS